MCRFAKDCPVHCSPIIRHSLAFSKPRHSRERRGQKPKAKIITGPKARKRDCASRLMPRKPSGPDGPRWRLKPKKSGRFFLFVVLLAAMNTDRVFLARHHIGIHHDFGHAFHIGQIEHGIE